jgi:uncharacterized protein
MKGCRHVRLLAVWLGLTLAGFAAETLPPKPAHYFNDSAGVVPAATAAQLNAKLEAFERTTSCQVVVAVFPKMQSDSSLEDYAQRLFQAWQLGQKDKNNGVAFLVFTQDRKMRIQTGYGLEGALPDALCKRIIADEVAPAFKRGDFAAGLTAGVEAILRATRGEYQGTGSTVANKKPLNHVLNIVPLVFIIVMLVVIVISKARMPSGTVYHRGGGTYWGGSSWGGGGGGGGFSGGGGSSGGGGASGSW